MPITIIQSNVFDNRADTVETASKAASRMTRLLCKTLLINATVNSSTGNSNTDTTSGGLVQSPSSHPTATPGVTFDAAKLQKHLDICKHFSEKTVIARLAIQVLEIHVTCDAWMKRMGFQSAQKCK